MESERGNTRKQESRKKVVPTLRPASLLWMFMRCLPWASLPLFSLRSRSRMSMKFFANLTVNKCVTVVNKIYLCACKLLLVSVVDVVPAAAPDPLRLELAGPGGLGAAAGGQLAVAAPARHAVSHPRGRDRVREGSLSRS